MKVSRLTPVAPISDEALLSSSWSNFPDTPTSAISSNATPPLVGDPGLWLGVGVAEGVLLPVEIHSLDLVTVASEINTRVQGIQKT